MNVPHDPIQCTKQLLQILAADKLSVGFLLGAGCPSAIRIPQEGAAGDSPLIPDMAGLTIIVNEKIHAIDLCNKPFEVLLGILEEDGFKNPNIETYLSRVRSLRDAAGNKDVRGLSAEALDILDQEICRSIATAVNCTLPSGATPYNALARLLKRRRVPPAQIFTTNYDLLVEQALEFDQVPYFDGFVGSSTPFFDQRSIEDDRLPPRWSLVWKLHGSLNWRYSRKTKVISRSRDQVDGDELLIHPSHRKYDESRRMPYLVMMDRLKLFLRNKKLPVALIVVGHSFSDEHLNESIIESLKINPSAACYAFQYGGLGDYAKLTGLAKANSNLSVYAPDGAIIRARENKWLLRPGSDPTTVRTAFDVEVPDEGRESEKSLTCQFRLGDFGRFGHFLGIVSGELSF